ncbi:hypothetical protein [Aureliella helgolandensis]|uniref:Heparinase II/III-like protein n=1 Tax=Aureliella helgolandensis TaxID=2527968 RepID=A0A518G2A4_9BACT|nr:hypothetical protein [Aureliella helgolandensis]QDV22743.1 hypothetical protein Q31a_10290 [Aureliella helgolandensis]
MDWIDPRYQVNVEGKTVTDREDPTTKSKRRKRPTSPFKAQVQAALAQPLDVWGAAFGHALSGLKWPSGCNAENSFLFSSVIQEQAEVLVRSGMSARKLAAILSTESESAVPTEPQSSTPDNVVGLMSVPLETIAFQWLDTADAYAHSALAVAALAWQIPDHAQRPGNEWLTRWLQACNDRILKYTPDLEEAVLCHLVLQCELPLLIGIATATSKRTVLAQASTAMDNLAEHLERSLDNAAPWLVHGATYLRASLASVLRSRILANELGLRKWFPPQQKALSRLLKHAARWARPDGTQLLAAGNNPPRSKAIWNALAMQTRGSKPMQYAMALSGIGNQKRSEVLSKIDPDKLPPFTHYSENAAGACMQADWVHKGGRVAFDFSDTNICMEVLGPKGQSVLSGEWTAEVRLDNALQPQVDEWQELCWFSDADVDYIELEAKFGDQACIQRQLMLLREDKLLLVADALLGDADGDWSLTAQIPLAGGAEFMPSEKNTEGRIQLHSGAQCMVLPLFLPEWRRQQQTGSLDATPENLIVQQAISGKRRLYMPTLISLNGSHAKREFTWRRLSVGEELRVVGADEAAAYRVQIAKEQWLLYRTLAPATRRTALGMHTLSDFYAAKFCSEEGETDTLVDVEAPAKR